MKVIHEGFESFRKGKFGNSGANLFVDAEGVVRRITEQDLNGDGNFDIVFPNSHGYIERGPTSIFTRRDGKWEETVLPHDSCWKTKTVDLDGDGFEDLVIANGENGVTSDLTSYVYWGGKDGLTGERSEFKTYGAYDLAAIDLTGNGLLDLVFTSAWHDHHYPGFNYNQRIFLQEAPRQFRDATEEVRVNLNTVMSVSSADLSGNGFQSLILSGFRSKESWESKAHIFYGGPDGLAKMEETLDTRLVTGMLMKDVYGSGRPDLVLTGGNRVTIHRNVNGRFSNSEKLVIEVPGAMTQFFSGRLGCDIDDIDGDGESEIIIGTSEGIEIRKISNPQQIWRKIDGFFCSGVKICDMDGDGRKDIVAAVYSSVKSYDTDSFVFYNENNSWSFNHVDRIPTHGAVNVDTADFDHDGVPEIIVCNTMAGPNQRDPEFPVYVYYGRDGVYPEENRVNYPVDSGAYSFTAGDIDNDGWPELIATSWDGARVFQGGPKGPDPRNYYDIKEPFGRLGGGVILADFNSDGYLDLLMTTGASPDISPSNMTVFWGGKNGYSDKNISILPAEMGCAQALAVVDINGDGYLDIVYGTRDGNVGIVYGTEEGLDICSEPKKIPLRTNNGVELMGLTVADINKDGKLEIITTSCGHYTRKKSFLTILFDPDNDYPIEKQVAFDTGGTTGYVSFADLRNCGCLDMIVPFYSTTETRVLPMRIFRNDGKGNYDFEHPQIIQCESSIASLAVDLDRNGYPDLLVCCHRNDLGHTVQSLLFHNGPEGLDFDHPQKLWAYGPHDFTRNCLFNCMDRSESEFYTSPEISVNGFSIHLSWTAECSKTTRLKFRLRFARSAQLLEKASWSEPVEKGSRIDVPKEARYMQYQVEFIAENACGSPKLTKVEIY